MDVKSVAPIAVDRVAAPVPPAARPTSEAKAAPESPALRNELTGPLAAKVLQDSGIRPEEIFKYRVQLDIDKPTGRVVAEVRNKESGELVTEVPSRTLLRHAAMLREALGMILDKPV